jgi:pimeloyl-ACP methyl ester carboxylesterase
MSILRSFAMRAALPRATVLEQKDVPDLSTYSARAADTLASDSLHIAPPKEYWTELTAEVPGRLVEGTLPSDHAARFLLRLPRDWNGRLVVAAASGITDEHTYDLYFSDFLLSRGYAFAATDKGVRRAVLDGDTVLMPHTPENSVRVWSARLQALVELSIATAQRHYGKRPAKTYAVGLSNGGYVARRAAETRSGLIDGALDISGVLWRADEGNVLRELPAALRAAAGSWDRAALKAAGFPAEQPRWDPVISQYRDVYWEAVVHLFLGDLDPEYVGEAQDYDLDARPAFVREAIATFENSGDLQVPLISVAGGHDFLISCAGHALAYRDLVRGRGKDALHRLTLIEDATHIDTDRQSFPFIEPLMPHAHAAFEELVLWVEAGGAATAPSSRRRRPATRP